MTVRSRPHRRLLAMVGLLALSWLAAANGPAVTAQKTDDSEKLDPTRGEVPLPAEKGWNAFLVQDAGVGVWAVKAVPFHPPFGSPQIVGLDERGRCQILYGYSGRWTPLTALHDGYWLGGMAWIDLDPRRPGCELYVGGKRGRLYQVHPCEKGGVEVRVVENFRGEEISTLAGGRLRAGPESPPAMLVFTTLGGVYLVDVPPDATADSYRARQIARVPGRVRDAVTVGRLDDGEAPWVATVSHASEVALVRLADNDRLERKVILAEPMGFGRLALRPPGGDAPPVLYVGRDDGALLRLQRNRDGSWRREMIYAGPQGIRGVVAGRFDADPEAESVAVFGYSGKVQVVTRRPGKAWTAETIFKDRDRGHALAVAELDGRNATREIVGSGYGCRIFLLSRPPGYGLEGVAVDPDQREANEAGKPEKKNRVHVPAGCDAVGKDFDWVEYDKRKLYVPKEIRHRKTGIELVLIVQGEYWMGASPGDEKAESAEKPRHRVKIAQPFYLGKYEVTNGQYRKFKPDHDSGSFKDYSLNGDRQPVVMVRWNDVKAFCSKYDFRLPTEAEWEYACRAGSTTRYPWGDSGAGGKGWANCLDQTAKRKWPDWPAFSWDDGYAVSSPVGGFKANPFGLHDMTGGVWEWCSDWYDEDWYQKCSGVDGGGPDSGKCRVLRGGSWGTFPLRCRSSYRHKFEPSSCGDNYGFRVAGTP